MDTFSLMKESVCYAENESPVPGGGRGLPGLPVKAQMLSQADVHKVTREDTRMYPRPNTAEENC